MVLTEQPQSRHSKQYTKNAPKARRGHSREGSIKSGATDPVTLSNRWATGSSQLFMNTANDIFATGHTTTYGYARQTDT